MELHHVDRPRVARELRHHLASSQVPELGQGGMDVRTSPGPRLPAPKHSIPKPTPGLDRLGMCALMGGGRGPNPGVIGRPPAPSPGPRSGRELPSLCGHLRPMPTTSHRG